MNNDPSIPVVAIGASAGGLEQLKLLLQRMPPDPGAAFVIIQHLDPEHESHLAELLNQTGELPAVAIENGMPLEGNRVHVLTPGQRLTLADNGRLQLSASDAIRARPTLIDHFYRSLAATAGDRAIGIVLSGSGSDGALGLKAIRSAGGLAMAQDPDSAEFDGMPRAAAKYASPDCLLNTADMVTPLCRHLRLTQHHDDPRSDEQEDSSGSAEGSESEESDHDTAKEADINAISDEVLTSALETLREHDNKYNFQHHKTSMLKRRLRRRMALSGVTDIQYYLQVLASDYSERSRLCNDFLISVTDFFREPESYAVLNQQVIARLLHQRSVNNPIRVWVPACATVEEAYSIAMLLAEAIEASGHDHQYLVFATDVDETALARARAGLYPDSIEADLSSERLRTFFNKVDDHYQVKSDLRERVVFAPQSVIGDPPYSRLDLISCRNLLIYLNAEAQRHLIQLFHFALNEDGFLFLGSSETVGRHIDLFEPVSKTHRLYHRLATTRRYQLDFPGAQGTLDAHRAQGTPGGTQSTSSGYAAEPKKAEQVARDILLAEHVPATVLVNRKLEILCSYGPTRDYLSLPLGESSLALLEMINPDYRSHLRAVAHRAFRYGESNDITTRFKGDARQTLLITARPLQQPEQMRGLALITFERRPETPSAQPGDADGSLGQRLAEELEDTRNELHSTIAALEESNENLKGSNEEIMSMNEELQSTNEELETSKEELQSVNEELTTVNTELENKVAELENAHNDLSNLFAGTQVATLFLDQSLCIKRFTPAIRALLNLISSDIGRPLRDMTLKFRDPELLNDAARVLDELTPREAEVPAGEQWYQRRILPYRTHNNVIKGVVITFVDITELKGAMQTAQENEQRLDLAISAFSGGSWEMSLDPDRPDQLPDDIFLSPRLKNLLGFGAEQIPNSLQAWTDRIMPEDRERFSNAGRRHQGTDSPPLHYRIRHRDGSIRWFASYSRVVTDTRSQSMRWLGIDCDITAYKKAEIGARHIRTQMHLMADALPEMLALIDSTDVIRFANTALKDWLDTDGKDVIGRSITEVLDEALLAELATCMEAALEGRTVGCGVDLPGAGQTQCRFQINCIPHINNDQVLGYCLVLTRKPDDDGPADTEAEQRKLAYIQRMATIGEMASTLAHDLSQPLGAINSYASGLMRMLNNGKPSEETTPVLRKMADQVERAGDIVDNVRSFVGRREENHELVNINQLLQRCLTLCSSYADRLGVNMHCSEHTPQPQVKGDAVQLQQVLVNLVNNAIEAVQDNEPDQRTLWLAVEAPKADHVRVVVEDSGPGIPADQLNAIFDSFNTSKLEGMGMGLAISRSIMAWHGGRLWAEIAAGGGARFCLSLPVVPGQPEDAE